MQQGKVVALMRVLMGLDRLCELSHHRPHSIRLVEPLDKQMHPHKRQTGRHLDDLCARGNKPIAFSLPGSAPATIEPPCCPDRKSTRLNASHVARSYAAICLKEKTTG